MPVGAAFHLGYGQEEQQHAGHAIIFSDAPQNTGTNKRRQAVNPSWGSPYMFGPTVMARHLQKFHAACSRGVATVMIVGDSIFNAGANLANPQQCPWEHILDKIKVENPGVRLTDYNMTWGGQTWGDIASSDNAASVPPWVPGQDGTTCWLDLCLLKKPHLVFLWFGGNDGNTVNPANIDKVVKSFQAIGSDVILCETFQPNTGSKIGNYYLESVQDGIHYVRRYITSYAQAHGLGYLPFGRWVDMARDGFDPESLALPEVIAQAGTAYPARYTTIPVDMLANSKDYQFPDIKNMLGVSAAKCTDWCIAIEHDGVNPLTTAWRMSLSSSDKTGDGYENDLWLFFNKDNIAFHVTDAAGNKTVHQTNIPVPRNKWQFWMMVRGGRVVFAMRLPFNNGWVSQNPEEQSSGLGYTHIFDQYIPRCGASYTPLIAGISSNSESFRISAFGVADATRADGGGTRYRPISNALAQYYDTTQIDGNPNAGGSGDYHLNNFGVRDMLWPVVDGQQWGAPVAQAILNSLFDVNAGYYTAKNPTPVTMDSAFSGTAIGYNSNFGEIHVKGGETTQGFRIVFRNDDGSWKSIPISVNNDGSVAIGEILICGNSIWLGRFAKSDLPMAAEGAMAWCNDLNAPVFATGGKWYPATLGSAVN
ncbi:hypothetical protein AD930_14720 [Acetobacter malorum]|nr:hypothetical protein AD930_14720 [Acetobacter malorum]